MVNAKRQRITLAAQFGMVALGHLGAGTTRQLGGIIIAVVGNHQQAVAPAQLALQAGNGGQHIDRFVVRRHQHGHPDFTSHQRCQVGLRVTAQPQRGQRECQQRQRGQRQRDHGQGQQ